MTFDDPKWPQMTQFLECGALAPKFRLYLGSRYGRNFDLTSKPMRQALEVTYDFKKNKLKLDVLPLNF